MAAITIVDVPAAGLASLTFAAASAGGDTIAFGTKQAAGWEQYSVVLIVKNAAGVTQDITVGALGAVTCPATTGMSTWTVAAVRILP